MKHSIAILLFLLPTLFYSDASAISPILSNNVKLTGTVSDYNGEYMLFRYKDQLDTIWVKEGGSFTYAFEMDQPMECRILAARTQQRLFLQPGDLLNIEFSAASNTAYPKITGATAAYSSFYERFMLEDKSNLRFTHTKVTVGKGPSVVATQMDSVTNVRIAFVQKYCKENNLNQAFCDYQITAMRYLCSSDMAAYRRMSNFYNPDSIPGETKMFDQVMMKVPTNNPGFIYNEYYQSYVRQIAMGNAQKSMQLTSAEQLPEFYSLQFDEIMKLVVNQEGRNYLLKELVVDAIKETGTRNIQPLIDRFNTSCDNEPMKQRVARVWNPYKAIQVGMPCPDMECYFSNGDNINVRELKGKVVYMDVWATWCGPCKKEIPMLKELEAYYHDRGVEFMSISTDQDVEKWKAFIIDQSLTGLQVHQSDNMDLSVSKNFMVNSIPRFILLDKEGNIVSADAPRPSSGAVIREMIDKLLL